MIDTPKECPKCNGTGFYSHEAPTRDGTVTNSCDCSQTPKQCPFCEENNLTVSTIGIVPENHPDMYLVICLYCGETGPIKDTKKLAVKAWNEIDCPIEDALSAEKR